MKYFKKRKILEIDYHSTRMINKKAFLIFLVAFIFILGTMGVSYAYFIDITKTTEKIIASEVLVYIAALPSNYLPWFHPNYKFL